MAGLGCSALRSIGETPVAALMQSLQSTNNHVRFIVADCLDNIDPARREAAVKSNFALDVPAEPPTLGS